MTSPASPPKASVEDSGAFPGQDKIVVQVGPSSLRGYTQESAWQADLLQSSTTTPPILFEGESSPREIALAGARFRFVKSFEVRKEREPIHFHDNGPLAELLWVRVQLEGEAEMEGMLANSDALLQDVLSLTPADPETNDVRVLFQRSAVRAFYVLGVRSASR